MEYIYMCSGERKSLDKHIIRCRKMAALTHSESSWFNFAVNLQDAVKRGSELDTGLISPGISKALDEI